MVVIGAERVLDSLFELDRPSPYMLLTAPVKEVLCFPPTENEEAFELVQRIGLARSQLPAVTHVDYSARIQSVDGRYNPRFSSLIEAFEKLTGVGVVINTSFNVRGEPIVCTPEDAYRCFVRTNMDYLVLESFLLKKDEQPHTIEDQSRRAPFPLD